MLKAKGWKILNTFFSDETGYSLSEAHKTKVWNPPRKQVKVELPKQDVRINCCGAISYNGSTSLHIYKESLKSDRYEKILEDHQEEMDDLYPHGYFFQQDKSSIHVAAISSIKKLGYDIIDFPTYSPDLKPIENL